MSKLRFAIIGCGNVCSKHIKAIVDNYREAELVSICDVLEEKTQSKINEYMEAAQENRLIVKKPKIYLNYKEMLAQEYLDACAICTISGSRPPIAIDCMNSKKHILVEKPMALSLSDADRMIETAEKNRVKLSVSHQLRFKAIMKRIEEALRERRLGKIISISTKILRNRNKEYYNQAKWRGTWELDGGCLLNQCSHHVDLLQWFMDSEIYSIYGQTDNFTHPYIETEDYGSITIRYKNGSIGNIEGTVSVYPKNLNESLTIIGEKGTVAIDGLGLNKILTWDFAGKQENVEEVQKVCDFEDEKYFGKEHSPLYEDFISAIKKGNTPAIDGYEGKKSLEIILMAYKSQKENRPIVYQKDLNISTTDFIGMLNKDSR